MHDELVADRGKAGTIEAAEGTLPQRLERRLVAVDEAAAARAVRFNVVETSRIDASTGGSRPIATRLTETRLRDGPDLLARIRVRFLGDRTGEYELIVQARALVRTENLARLVQRGPDGASARCAVGAGACAAVIAA
jgi:hypothetical protein